MYDFICIFVRFSEGVRLLRNKLNEEVFLYSRNRNQPIATALCGITFPNVNYKIVRQKSNAYSIEYVYEGEGIVQQNDEIYKVGAGDCFILHPNTYHHYYASPTNPWKKIWILIENNYGFVDHLMSDYGLEQTVLVKDLNDPSKFEACLSVAKSSDPSQKMELALLELIAGLSDFVFLHGNSSGTKCADELNRLFKRNLYGTLTMKDCCDYVGMGKSQLTELFKQAYDDTPMAYYMKMKLMSAKTYLEQTEYSVSEISMKHSFKSVYHFSAFFKKQTGMSPTEYRLNCKLR